MINDILSDTDTISECGKKEKKIKQSSGISNNNSEYFEEQKIDNKNKVKDINIDIDKDKDINIAFKYIKKNYKMKNYKIYQINVIQ
jgi:hypothetical protein